MTQEEKNLLLNDLCARLPYYTELYSNVADGNWAILTPVIIYNLINADKDLVIKPYLRPMSSMTDEEKKELKSATCPKGTGYFDEQYLICPMSHFGEHISYDFMSDILDWLNEHHFDYRGLIEKGLALEAPEGMYKTE